jgi:hypothetical protein
MSMIVNPFLFGGAPSLPAPSIVFMAGAEHETRGDEKCKGTTHSTAPASGVAGAHGRAYDNTSFQLIVNDFGTAATLTIKFRVRFRSLSAVNFLSIRTSSSQHFGLEANADGTCDFIGQALTHTTAATVFVIDTWYEIELTGHIDNSAGTYTLKIDGVIPSKSGGGTMTGTGLDLQNGATTTANNILIGNATVDTYIDDLVIDSAGSDIGLGQVETLYPDGAGDFSEMTRGGADSGANWSQVDEATHNSDTDYVANTVADKRDCYTFQNRSVTGTPRAVQPVATVKRNASGTFTFRLFLRIGGVTYDGAVVHTATSAYLCYYETWNTNPATGLPWTDSEINSLQAGVHAIDANVRPTQMVLEVFVTT